MRYPSRRLTPRHLRAGLLIIAIGFAVSALLLLAPWGNLRAQAAENGPWAVSSTNLELDEGLVAPGRKLYDYLTGDMSGGETIYLDSLLVSPDETFGFQVPVPDDPFLFRGLAGREVTVTGFFLHPTSAQNQREDYTLPGFGVTLPRMTRTGQEPLWPESGGPWPLVVYSHGLGGFPGEFAELDFLADLASQGYLVLCLFHGDGRFPRDMETRHALQLALRTVTLKQALDFLEESPSWAPRIDWSRIGGLGVSYGGTSMLTWAGAGVFDPETGRIGPILADPRLKAAGSVVTFSGIPLLPVFGPRQEGGATLTVPQMIVCGDEDLIAPCQFSRAVLENSPLTGYLVTLFGQSHYVAGTIQKDAQDWLSVFLSAYLKNDKEALRLLHTRTTNPGGGEDLLKVVNPPYNRIEN